MRVGNITPEHIQRLSDAGIKVDSETTAEDLLKHIPPVLSKGREYWLNFGMFADRKKVKAGYYGKFREQHITEGETMTDALVGLLVKLSIHEDGAIVK